MSSTFKSFQRQLRGFVVFDIEFDNKTGLLIRMPVQAQAYRIGGAETYPMITKRFYQSINEFLEVPYVPGSSLKGRLRGLLELALGKKLYTTDQKIWQHVRNLSAMNIDDFAKDVEERCLVDELFGYAAMNYRQVYEKFEREGKSIDINKIDSIFSTLAITRLLVDDFFPVEDYVKSIGAKSIADFLEEKSENRIDRVTSAADPRDIVRVKPGVKFGGRLTLLLFDHDDNMVEKYLLALATGLRLVEETYLGASGSRGYGRVKFTKIAVLVEKVDVKDGAPRVIQLAELKKEYKSLNEFEKDVQSLAEKVKKAIFS